MFVDRLSRNFDLWSDLTAARPPIFLIPAPIWRIPKNKRTPWVRLFRKVAQGGALRTRPKPPVCLEAFEERVEAPALFVAQVVVGRPRCRAFAPVGQDCFVDAGGRAVMHEVGLVAHAPQGCGPPVAASGAAHGAFVGEGGSHIVHQEVAEDADAFVAQGVDAVGGAVGPGNVVVLRGHIFLGVAVRAADLLKDLFAFSRVVADVAAGGRGDERLEVQEPKRVLAVGIVDLVGCDVAFGRDCAPVGGVFPLEERAADSKFDVEGFVGELPQGGGLGFPSEAAHARGTKGLGAGQVGRKAGIGPDGFKLDAKVGESENVSIPPVVLVFEDVFVLDGIDEPKAKDCAGVPNTDAGLGPKHGDGRLPIVALDVAGRGLG